jgi:hypothetical protein
VLLRLRQTLEGVPASVRKVDRLRVGWLGGVPREQKMFKGHLPRVIHHRVYSAYEEDVRLPRPRRTLEGVPAPVGRQM